MRCFQLEFEALSSDGSVSYVYQNRLEENSKFHSYVRLY